MTTATATAEKLTASTAKQHILSRCVCIILRCGYLGNKRRISLDPIEMKKDGAVLEDDAKDECGANKKLFSPRDLRPATSAVAAVKNGLAALSVDGGRRIFGSGAYLIPRMAVDRAEQLLVDGEALVRQKAEELVAKLPDLKDARKAKLGPLYVESEYPTPDELRAAYSIDWSYVSFVAPENLEEVSEAAYARSKAKQDERLAGAYKDVIVGLRQGAALVMRELAERLGTDEDGEPKVLRPTALRDLNELLENLPVLNSVSEDDRLAASLARVGVLARGLNVELLRENESIRGLLLETAKEAAGKLEALVSEGERGISFD